MRPALEFADERELRKILVIDPPDLENIVRADLHAIPLSFAHIAIHDRKVCASFSPTFSFGDVRALRCAPRLARLKARMAFRRIFR